MSKKENPNAFKLWVSPALVDQYARALAAVSPEFSAREFRRLKDQLDALELRGRVQLLADGFHQYLAHPDYPRALVYLLQAVRAEGLEGFALWPVTEFIQRHGLAHFDVSLDALYELTQKFTAEFAVRPFLIQQPTRTLQYLTQRLADPNEHIRRWISEGTRPRLPWGQRLPAFVQDPTPGLALLEALRFDSSLYVRKSVANHLNDIAKDHPDQVVKTLARWQTAVPAGYEKEFQFILSRALRTLIKAGHAPALALVGIRDAGAQVRVGDLRLSPARVSVGEKLTFRVTFTNVGKNPVNYLMDYAVHHRKADGGLSPKVFKGKGGRLEAGASVTVERRHSFKPITTRKYYSGKHELEILLNGRSVGKQVFQLVAR